MARSASRFSALILMGASLLAACDVPTGGGFGGASLGGASLGGGGGGTATAGVPVALNQSGQDTCGAVDHKFLEGQPFAHTFDLRLPASTRLVGRRQTAAVENPSRLTMVVSTRSPGMAAFTPDAKVLRVFCG
ncbi:MAG: hypothetical protein AAF386_07645 [Pseudomonadota bacterium]